MLEERGVRVKNALVERLKRLTKEREINWQSASMPGTGLGEKAKIFDRCYTAELPTTVKGREVIARIGITTTIVQDPDGSYQWTGIELEFYRVKGEKKSFWFRTGVEAVYDLFWKIDERYENAQKQRAAAAKRKKRLLNKRKPRGSSTAKRLLEILQ